MDETAKFLMQQYEQSLDNYLKAEVPVKEVLTKDSAGEYVGHYWFYPTDEKGINLPSDKNDKFLEAEENLTTLTEYMESKK